MLAKQMYIVVIASLFGQDVSRLFTLSHSDSLLFSNAVAVVFSKCYEVFVHKLSIFRV